MAGHKRRTGEPQAHLCECGEHAWTAVTAGYTTMSDPDNAALLAACFWFAAGPGYARGTIDGRTDYLHRIVAKTPHKMQTDHRDRNTMNNRRSNLRQCTPYQNHGNATKQSRNTSGYKGVCWSKSDMKWQSATRLNGRTIFLGLFDTPEAAALAYNAEALKRFGEFARLNDVPSQ